MYFEDCVLLAVTAALDEDLPPELLPLTVTSHAGMLAGVSADHSDIQLWG